MDIKNGITFTSESANFWNTQEKQVPSQERGGLRCKLPHLNSAQVGEVAYP